MDLLRMNASYHRHPRAVASVRESASVADYALAENSSALIASEAAYGS